jgi:DNA-binding transcriptional LysR family regulator
VELRQLTYFVAVAEEGSFTRASERLYIAQPAVSRQIRRLERELGARLFARRPDGVRLTGAGDALLPRARRVLADAADCRTQVAAAAGLMRGRISVGSLFAAPRLRLPRLLAAYHRRHPAIDMACHEDTTERLIDRVHDGTDDVAFVAPASERWPSGLAAELVDRERALLLVPSGHHLARRDQVALADLEHEGLVSLGVGTGQRTMIESACRRAGFEPRIACEAGNVGLLVHMAAEGLGVTFVPESAAPRGDRFRCFQLDDPALERRISLLWRSETASAAPVAAFLSLAREHCRRQRHAAALWPA